MVAAIDGTHEIYVVVALLVGLCLPGMFVTAYLLNQFPEMLMKAGLFGHDLNKLSRPKM